MKSCSFPFFLFLKVYPPQLKSTCTKPWAWWIIDQHIAKQKVLPNLSLRGNFSLYLTEELSAFTSAMIYVLYTLFLSLKELHLDWGVPSDQVSTGMCSLQMDFPLWKIIYLLIPDFRLSDSPPGAEVGLLGIWKSETSSPWSDLFLLHHCLASACSRAATARCRVHAERLTPPEGAKLLQGP